MTKKRGDSMTNICNKTKFVGFGFLITKNPGELTTELSTSEKSTEAVASKCLTKESPKTKPTIEQLKERLAKVTNELEKTKREHMILVSLGHGKPSIGDKQLCGGPKPGKTKEDVKKERAELRALNRKASGLAQKKMRLEERIERRSASQKV